MKIQGSDDAVTDWLLAYIRAPKDVEACVVIAKDLTGDNVLVLICEGIVPNIGLCPSHARSFIRLCMSRWPAECAGMCRAISEALAVIEGRNGARTVH